MRTGTIQAPLHPGQCPPWLFARMKELGSAMIEVIIIEYGTEEVLRRLSDPLWFQTFGCILGFDWHSSGLTTVVCGALKEGLHHKQGELGLFLAGGKGRVSRRTPEEIAQAGDKYALANDLAELQHTSRLVAKVDSAGVQDGYQLYHHFFIFDKRGNWAVIQQGMNNLNNYARRYHWLSENISSFVEDPHNAICGEQEMGVLNLVSHDNNTVRQASVDLTCQKPEQVLQIYRRLVEKAKMREIKQLSLWEEDFFEDGKEYLNSYTLPAHHYLPAVNHVNKALFELYNHDISDYTGLIATPGVGAGTLRALSMVAEVTHGVKASFTDPVRYSFAHGGKDGIPFPVQRTDMEHSVNVLKKALEQAKCGNKDKLDALRRLGKKEEELYNGLPN